MMKLLVHNESCGFIPQCICSKRCLKSPDLKIQGGGKDFKIKLEIITESKNTSPFLHTQEWWNHHTSTYIFLLKTKLWRQCCYIGLHFMQFLLYSVHLLKVSAATHTEASSQRRDFDMGFFLFRGCVLVNSNATEH